MGLNRWIFFHILSARSLACLVLLFISSSSPHVTFNTDFYSTKRESALSVSKSCLLKESQMKSKSMYTLHINHPISVLIQHILKPPQHLFIGSGNSLIGNG